MAQPLFFMRDQLVNQVQGFLQGCGLWFRDAQLLVALSGGPDSLALSHVLWRLMRGDGPQITLFHLDHTIRGDAARADAAFVVALATAWDLPLVREQRDVPALARAWKLGLPAAARRARYELLAATARRLGVQAVAVAHQADDQAETVLLHLLRGAGPAGLRGMLPLTPGRQWAAEYLGAESLHLMPPLIRPLLTTPRDEILQYCADQQLSPRDDASNRDRHYARSRLRHDLLPALIAENPQAVAALGRTARICAEDYAFLQAQLDAIWPELAEISSAWVRLHAGPWNDLHPTLQRYALRRAASALGAAEPSLAQIEAARTLPSGSGMILIADLLVERDQRGLTVGTPDASAMPQLAVDRVLLEPGVTGIGAGWELVLGADPPEATDRWWLALDRAALSGDLAVRRRRPGDRFRPLGGRGSRRLQDYFVDVRLPRPLRNAWPILICADTIVWPIGWRPDERFVARPETTDTIWVGARKEDQRIHDTTAQG
ncbi:MAG: tRNA lysidine(34) synthetase TilS [Oscillochloris sp.]|nr:tRNA lysidine(34) synthetase TilS [Oscillochloris sp.]